MSLFAPPTGTELLHPIGTGTLFQVALVREGDRPLICKRLTPRALREPAGRAAIVREAKVLALARHPALPAVVRVGTDENGPFVLQTRAVGTSVRSLVEGWRQRNEPVPGLLVRHLGRMATRALAEVHALAGKGGPLGIVHGDLGPDHVLLGELGDVQFIDFGAARWRDMDPSLLGTDRGTLPYVAPEVARGDEPPSAAADVYALAATLVFLAIGEPPCTAREEAAMLVEIGEHGISSERVEKAAAFTAPERAALLGALRFEPAGRQRSAAALMSAFAG